MTHRETRAADEPNEREADRAAEERDGRVGRMMPIDPGVGAGGTTALPDPTDARDPGEAPGADRGMTETR